MDERRQGARRGEERREFRREDGRRDPEGPSRRRSVGRYLLPLLVLLLPLAFGGIYRSKIVVPREQTEALAGRVGAEVRRVLSETALPGLSFPGAAEARDLPPWSDEIQLPPLRRTDFASACGNLPSGLSVVREVPAIGRAGALCSLLLGEHELARARWERVVAYGARQQVAEAKIGLALLAMKQGLSSTDPQDRFFAWDRAEMLLRSASLDSDAAGSATFNLEALESLRDRAARGLLGSEGLGGQIVGED